MSEESIDLKPVKESKRPIVNQPLGAKKSMTKVPGVANAKEEAARQKREALKRDELAAIVIQKWARGWKDRKRTSKKRSNMKYEIDYEHEKFTNDFKANDKFNLNQFLSKKVKLRQMNGTD